MSQKIIKARDVLEHTKILSPIDSVVVNLQIHSHDGVGQPLLEVVPADDELVIEAFINPEDINKIWTGLPADVRLISLSRRQREPMEGVVTNLSAVRLTNEQTGDDYYLARIKFSPETITSSKINLVAGMGADVFLRTGARSRSTTYFHLLQKVCNSASGKNEL